VDLQLTGDQRPGVLRPVGEGVLHDEHLLVHGGIRWRATPPPTAPSAAP
jgi:hypothetical protein